MRTFGILCGVVVALSVVGCGKDDNDQNIIIPPDMGEEMEDMRDGGGGDDADNNVVPDMVDTPDMPDVPDMETPDMGDDTCNGVMCEPGEECVNDVCVLTSSCASALDLGVMPLGVPQVVEGSLITEGIVDLEASCIGSDFESLRDRVITFEVEQDVTINYTVEWLGQYDGVVELRADCEDVNSAVYCNDNENDRDVSVTAGRYYLVLDQKFGNAGAFQATITATASVCTPGVRECDPNNDDTLLICQGPQTQVSAGCAGTCANGMCAGEMCNNAVLVSGAGKQTFTGDGVAYVPSNLDFGTNLNCTDSGDPDNAIATPGYEVIFYLPGLTAGDVVAIDAETNDSNLNAVFIIEMCGDTGSCAAAYKLTEQPDWVVTNPGNYYVIIDKRSSTNNPFEYSIQVF